MRPTAVLRSLSLAMLAAAALAPGTGAAAQEENVLHSFQYNGKDAAYPRAGVIFDKAGNLYGTSSSGGSSDGGAVFELSHKAGGGWTDTILYSFTPRPKYGADLISGLVFDTAGNLYGTTSLGGEKNYGRVFELSPKAGGGWTETMLHLFNHNGTDGTTPISGVIVDSAGNLYGTTVYGGTGICFSNGCGTVFELSPAANGRWNEKILYNFVNNGSDGINPYFGLTFDSAGNLYGTTYGGGANGQGTVFELTPAAGGTWTETVLHSFGSGIDTGFPESLVFYHGNIFGTTANGGSGSGNVFELTPASGGGWTEQILYSFTRGNSSENPTLPEGIVLDAVGNIYGTTGSGGTGLNGTVFELSPQAGGTWALNILYNFNDLGTDGAQPVGSPVRDKAGNLYGTTLYGGSDQSGTVFEVKP
jgi:uncharacterized repeat protein (TIGR03803 family)